MENVKQMFENISFSKNYVRFTITGRYILMFSDTRQYESRRFTYICCTTLQVNFLQAKCKHHKYLSKINLCRKFNLNRTIGKCSNQRKVLGGKGGEEIRKKIRPSQMSSQNESMQEISSKSDNGRMIKIRGEIGATAYKTQSL